MAPLTRSPAALLLAVALLVASYEAEAQNENEPRDETREDDEGVCLYSLFIFKPVPINRDEDTAAFLQASGELHNKMMEFCDTFQDGDGEFFGLGRKCHTKLSSNTSIPSVSVEVKGCCEGSAASALWEMFGDNLRRCKTIGRGQDPLKLDVTIVKGQEEEESGSPPPDSAPRAVETRSVAEDIDANDEQAIRGFEATVMDAIKDWRFWAILALSLIVMLLLLLLCICCLCRRHRRHEEQEAEEGENKSLRIRVDNSLPPSSPLLYTNGSIKSIVAVEDAAGRYPVACGDGSREIVDVEEEDDNRSLVPINEPRSSPLVQGSRSTKEMVAIDVDDGLNERRIVDNTCSEDDKEDLQQLSRWNAPSEEVFRNDLVAVDTADEPDSSMQQAPPAPTPWRMSRIGRMSASDEQMTYSQYRQQFGSGPKDLVAMPSDDGSQ